MLSSVSNQSCILSTLLCPWCQEKLYVLCPQKHPCLPGYRKQFWMWQVLSLWSALGMAIWRVIEIKPFTSSAHENMASLQILITNCWRNKSTRDDRGAMEALLCQAGDCKTSVIELGAGFNYLSVGGTTPPPKVFVLKGNTETGCSKWIEVK